MVKSSPACQTEVQNGPPGCSTVAPAAANGKSQWGPSWCRHRTRQHPGPEQRAIIESLRPSLRGWSKHISHPQPHYKVFLTFQSNMSAREIFFFLKTLGVHRFVRGQWMVFRGPRALKKPGVNMHFWEERALVSVEVSKASKLL